MGIFLFIIVYLIYYRPIFIFTIPTIHLLFPHPNYGYPGWNIYEKNKKSSNYFPHIYILFSKLNKKYVTFKSFWASLFRGTSVRIIDQLNYNIFSMTPEGFYLNPGIIRVLVHLQCLIIFWDQVVSNVIKGFSIPF